MTPDAAPGLHVYVHVPFCAKKCPYCHFYNLGPGDGRVAVYLDALEREVERRAAEGAFDGARLATLYWGGGTPSLLEPAAFERLADLTLAIAAPAAGFEWTVETNPDDADPDRFRAWRAAGVTRVSIGAQSFDARRLAFLGRVHGPGAALRAVEAAAATGFRDVSVDLMFNLAVPGRRAAWARDLATAFALPVTHVSLYGLTVEPGTAFRSRADRGERLTVPDRAYAAEYRAACRAARQAGFEHYEVSSFARPGHRGRHNVACWTGAPYVGLGPAAHSFDGARRSANVASLTEWAEALATGDDPRAFVERLGPAERALETLDLGLRTVEGAPVDHPLLAGPATAEVARALFAQGLVARRGGRLACTERGFLVVDEIVARLAAAEAPEAATGGDVRRLAVDPAKGSGRLTPAGPDR